MILRILLLCVFVFPGVLIPTGVFASVAEVQPELALREKTIKKVYFVSPFGGGLKNGVDPENALALAQLSNVMRSLTESTKLKFLPGQFQLNGTLDLRAPVGDKVLVVEGAEGAIIRGTFNPETLSGTASGMRLKTGNIVVRGLMFDHVGFCVKSEKYSTISQVLIENIVANNVHSCVLVDRDMEEPVTDWVVRNSRINGYYRVGVRLAGMQSRGFLLDKLIIDGENDFGVSECYKAGVQLLGGVHDVHLRDSKIVNTIGTCGEDYQQGDGIEADHKQGTPSGILIENVVVGNSGDAELDLKADHVQMRNVRTLGGDKVRYAFKVWAYDNYVCEHCFGFGVNKAYVNLNEAQMKFYDSTFANQDSVRLCDLRHGATPELQSKVEFFRARMYVGNEEWVPECGAAALNSVKRLPAGNISAPRPASGLHVH